MVQLALGLGSNLGARRALFRCALRLLESQPGCRVLARSQLYETPPLGPPQPCYLNAAVRVEWVGSAPSLWSLTRHIETLLGRTRAVRWGARTLDVDLLWSSEGPVHTGELTVPHPALMERSFALKPLLDVCPELTPEHCAALARAGGSPSLAGPGWLDATTSVGEGEAAGLWPSDPGELWSLAAARAADPVARARSALPFRAHRARTPEQLISTVSPALAAAERAGFAVADAAVLRITPDALFGLLVGAHLGKCGPQQRVGPGLGPGAAGPGIDAESR